MSTEDDREALNDVIYRAWNEEHPGNDVPWINELGRAKLADAILAAGFRRGAPAEPAAPPAYLALDLWQALNLPVSEFDAYFERNRWADTWANLLDRVRRLAGRKECPVMVDGEGCELMNGHSGPHMGASDVGTSEPLPHAAPAEPAVCCDIEWEYGRRNRETGESRALRGKPLDDWWHESQERYEHVRRAVGPWVALSTESGDR